MTGYSLPHDVHALGFDADQLAHAANIRVVHFMFHDRVAFGGTLLAVGCAYWFLAEFPLRAREPWAWWAFLVSGLCGFASCLTYFGYGYLDTWHAIATLFLLPVFAAGLWRARPERVRLGDVWKSNQPMSIGRWGLIFLAVGMLLAGSVIMTLGMTRVFVPQDLTFMQMSLADLSKVSPRLVPVIAHDRAGFGGGLFSTGTVLLFMARHARLSRSFIRAVATMGLAG